MIVFKKSLAFEFNALRRPISESCYAADLKCWVYFCTQVCLLADLRRPGISQLLSNALLQHLHNCDGRSHKQKHTLFYFFLFMNDASVTLNESTTLHLRKLSFIAHRTVLSCLVHTFFPNFMFPTS